MMRIYRLGLQYTSEETPFWDDHANFKTDDEDVLREGKIYLPYSVSREQILQINKKKLFKARLPLYRIFEGLSRTEYIELLEELKLRLDNLQNDQFPILIEDLCEAIRKIENPNAKLNSIDIFGMDCLMGKSFKPHINWKLVRLNLLRNPYSVNLLGDPCPDCGKPTVKMKLCTNENSWKNLYGRGGDFSFCPHCKKELSFKLFVMN